MIALNKTIRLFLDGIGRRDEYEFYLDKFRTDHAACFALLCPDLGSIEAGAEMLAFDLHFLLRLELVPAILLCGNDALSMRSALIMEPIFTFKPVDEGGLSSFIQQACERDKVPVLVAENRSMEEVLLELLPDVATRVHFIRAAGGLKNTEGELLPNIYTHKKNVPALAPLEYDFPALGKNILEARAGTHLSVTSSVNLLQEIFTVKGSGTLFRKGSKIDCFQGLKGVDRTRLLHLLETSFDKPLRSQAFLDNVVASYIEKDYRGAVLLENHPAGLYLSKFSVGREARGEGLSLELWSEVCDHHEALFWRSDESNSFNSWYRNQADGYHSNGKWQIFWRGISVDAISEIIKYSCVREEDFVLL